MAEYSLTPEELAVFLAAHATPGCIDEITELLMGAAADDLAAGRADDADSAAKLAALLATIQPDAT